jgi:signal transduction histidine kinase
MELESESRVKSQADDDRMPERQPQAEPDAAALREALAESEALCAAVAHELRSPIGAMSILGTLLSRESAHALDDEGRQILERLTECSRRTVTLMDRLVAYGRAGQQELKPVPLDMTAEVRAAFDEQVLQSAQGMTPALKVGELPVVVADQALMRLLLGNLLSNAAKCTAGRPEPTIEVSGEEHAGEVHYAVRDNGLGFQASQAPRLFTPFGRVHSQVELPGAGLGLAMVRRIARRHGGRAWAVGAPDRGATFHVALPREPGRGEPGRGEQGQVEPAARLAE